MKAWVLSIVGIICLGILLEIVLPEGKTTKYIRGAFSLVVICVIVAPLPALAKKDWNVDLGDISFSVDGGTVDGLYENYKTGLQTDIEKHLASNGYKASVSLDMNEGKIESVKVSLKAKSDESIQSQVLKVKEIVAKRIGVDESVVQVEVQS